MLASKVYFHKDFNNSDLFKSKMTREKKRLLREKLIKEYIQRRPYGAAISYSEFARICRYKNEQESWAIITRMVKEGQITRERIPGKRTFSYTVAGLVTVTKTKFKDNLEALAKDFAWEHGSDSLRDFINHLKGNGTI